MLEGSDLTVISWGAMVERCQAAIESLDVSVELIDLRTIIPWDRDLVLTSVRSTSRCLIVHEDIGTAGFGAEIAAVVAQEAFLDLDAPIERLAARDVPVPYNLDLMNAVIPTVDAIRSKISELLSY